jgi:hypothetical protein
MTKPIEERSELRTRLDPSNPNKSAYHMIAELDVAGHNQKEICIKMGYTASWVSRIMNSPMYPLIRDKKRADLHEAVIDKVSTDIADSETILKNAKAQAAGVLVDLLTNGRSDAVKASVATHIVDRGLSKKEGTTVVVQITERIADRFEKVFKYDDINRTPCNESRAVGDSPKEVS